MPLIPLFIQNEVTGDASSRLSAFNFCDPFDHILPISDGTVIARDRQHLWGMYSGIAAVSAGSGGRRPVAPWIKKNRQMKKGTRI